MLDDELTDQLGDKRLGIKVDDMVLRVKPIYDQDNAEAEGWESLDRPTEDWEIERAPQGEYEVRDEVTIGNDQSINPVNVDEMSCADIEAVIREYEDKYQLDSADIDQAVDNFDTNDWRILVNHRCDQSTASDDMVDAEWDKWNSTVAQLAIDDPLVAELMRRGGGVIGIELTPPELIPGEPGTDEYWEPDDEHYQDDYASEMWGGEF